MDKIYKNKPMQDWTEEDFAQDHKDRMEKLLQSAKDCELELQQNENNLNN